MVSQSKLNKEWQDYCDIVVILQFVEIFLVAILDKIHNILCMHDSAYHWTVAGVNGVVAVYVKTATIPFEFLDTCLF